MQILGSSEYVGDIYRKIAIDGLYSSISLYHEHRFNSSWHCHRNAHISFVLKGGCSEKKKNQYERLPGKLTYYLPEEPHQIISMHNSVHVNLELDDCFLKSFGFSPDDLEQAIRKTPDATLLMLNVYPELLAGDLLTDTSIEMLCLGFLRNAENWRHENKIPNWMNKVHELLHDRWSEALTLDEISREVGVHPVSISHYFPRYFSSTLGAYMRKLKIEKALEQLSAGVSLTAISYHCGFADQSHFIRTFKAMTGFLPSYYQKQSGTYE